MGKIIGLEGVRLMGKALPWVSNGVQMPSGRWFGLRFMLAASAVVDRWGPRWSKRRMLSMPVGAWVLACLWLAAPIAFLCALW